MYVRSVISIGGQDDMNHSNKLSIICRHPAKAVLISQMEPEDENDSGRLYSCEACADKVQRNIDDWQTMCEHCITFRLWQS